MRNCIRVLLSSSLILLAALALTTPARAADSWPAIVPEELALKDNPASPGSPAMILYREVQVNSKESWETYYFRIKIFTDEGKKFGDIEIPFFKSDEDIKDIHARTVHPDGKVTDYEGKVLEKLIVKAGEEKYLAKTFTLPDVTPGSVIEYKYRVQRDPRQLYNLSWGIQSSLYTKRAHYIYKPYDGPNAPALLIRRFRVENASPQKLKDGSWSLDVNDIPGVPDEDYMLPSDELRGRIEFVYTNEDHPAEARDYWNHVARELSDEEDQFIGKRGAIRDLVARTVSNDDSPESKLRKLYLRAQQIHNVDDDPEMTSQEAKRSKVKSNNNVEDVLKHGSGDSGEIDQLYVAMAQAAGFDSSIVFVAPRSRRRLHLEMQDRKELSDFLVWVRAGDKDFFLDPGISLCPFGTLPWYETNIAALRPTKQGAVMLQVPVMESSTSVIERRAQFSLDADGSLSGTLIIRYTGQRAFTRRKDAREEDEAGRTKMITDEVKEWLPSTAKFDLTGITGWDKPDAPLEVQGKVRIPGLAESVGKRLLLPVGLYQAGQQQMFSSDTRKQDVYFHYAYEDRDDVTIQVPPGWRAETLPAPAVLDPGGELRYEISARQEGDVLHLQRRLVIGAILYPVSSYRGVRKFFGTAKADDEQQIVLQSGAAPGGNQ